MALRADLAQLKLSGLIARTREMGLASALVEDAQDTDEPKEALVALILSMSFSPAPPAPQLQTSAASVQLFLRSCGLTREETGIFRIVPTTWS